MERKPYTREKDNPQDGREYSQITQPTGINLQNVQTAHVAQYQNHHPIKKGAEDLSRDFSKENIQMTNGYKEKMLNTLLIFREMQIRTTRRYHFTELSVRMAIIKKSTNNEC